MRRTLIGAIALLSMATVGCGKQSMTSHRTGQPTREAVHVGEVAPVFTLSSATGPPASLETLVEHRPTLLFFSMGPG